MLLKSPKLVKLLKDLLHEFDPFNFVVETDEERESLIVTIDDVSKLCKVKSDESIWILKNFSDRGLVWESLSGLNAYELDKKYNNFQGTLAEWFEHWRGYSAFEVWQQYIEQPEATEEQYIKHITGPAGDNVTIFSLEEKKSNKVWINNKIIWRKIVNVGQLPNGTTKTIPHEISNVENIINVFGFAQQNTATNVVPMPFANASNSIVGIQSDTSDIRITCVGNWTTYSGIAIVEYTKSTDLPLTQQEIDALTDGRGEPGKSSYDIAVENGFTGTEQEWYNFIINSNDKNILIYGSSAPKEYIPIINYQGSDPETHISDQSKLTFNKATYVREGKHLYVRGTFTTTVNGTGGRTDIFLPDNITIDNLNEQDSYKSVVGGVSRLGAADGNTYYIIANSGKKYVTLNYQNAAVNNFNVAANSPYSYWFKVPIKEWSGSKFLDEVITSTVGASAYEVAVKNGFEGTEAEWLQTLTAFNVAKENGYTGTEAEWNEALLDKTNHQIFAFSGGVETEYTPELTNVLTTENKAYYAREGRYLFVRGLVTFSSAFTGQFKIFLPDNLYSDGLIETTSTNEKYNVVGIATPWPAANYDFTVVAQNDSNWVTFKRGEGFIFSSGSYSGSTFTYQFKIPIKGWSGSKFSDELWDGTSGKSAYELAVINGFEGTEQEWLDSLDGYSVAKSVGYGGTKEEWVTALSETAKNNIYNYTAGTSIEYTPVIDNVNVTENKAVYIREGKTIYIRGYATFSSAFAGELRIHLPENINFELFKPNNVSMVLENNNIIGSAIVDPKWNYSINVCSQDNSNYFTFNRRSDNWTFNSSTLATYTLFYELKAPIKQWEGSLLGDQVWDGTVGKSAYEIAVKNGFIGTEQEWLSSLTTYDLAKKYGFTGTEAEWVNKLTQNAEKSIISYSGSTPIQYTPEWENINLEYSNAQYWREGKFLCVQGYAKFKNSTTAHIKLYIPNKDSLQIGDLLYETEIENGPCLVGNAQYYTGKSKHLYYVNAENDKNYVVFRKVSDDINDNLGSVATNLTNVGLTFFFKVPIKVWQGTQILDQIWDGTVGLSAYELAIKNGFVGTEIEWLDSLDAFETSKKRNLISSNATLEDWYKEISLYGLAVRYDNFEGTVHEYLAKFRTSVLPEGGSQGQILVKQSNEKDDAEWQSVSFPTVTYQHNQLTPSLKWEIQHNLNTTEYNYIVKDIDEELVICDINLEESTPNKLVLEFREAQGGTCTIFAKTDEYVPVQTKNIMVDQYTEKVINHGEVSGAFNIYVSDAPFQKFTLKGDTQLKTFNWGASGRMSSVTLMFFSTGTYILNMLDNVKWCDKMSLDFNMTADSNWRITLTSDDGGETIYGFINGFNFK